MFLKLLFHSTRKHSISDSLNYYKRVYSKDQQI